MLPLLLCFFPPSFVFCLCVYIGLTFWPSQLFICHTFNTLNPPWAGYMGLENFTNYFPALKHTEQKSEKDIPLVMTYWAPSIPQQSDRPWQQQQRWEGDWLITPYVDVAFWGLQSTLLFTGYLTWRWLNSPPQLNIRCKRQPTEIYKTLALRIYLQHLPFLLYSSQNRFNSQIPTLLMSGPPITKEICLVALMKN